MRRGVVGVRSEVASGRSLTAPRATLLEVWKAVSTANTSATVTVEAMVCLRERNGRKHHRPKHKVGSHTTECGDGWESGTAGTARHCAHGDASSARGLPVTLSSRAAAMTRFSVFTTAASRLLFPRHASAQSPTLVLSVHGRTLNLPTRDEAGGRRPNTSGRLVARSRHTLVASHT